MKKLKFETFSSEFKQVNQEFMSVKINVCYAGKNRNMSIIEKDVLDRMANTIYGVPVVGEIDKKNKKFKGHGGKLEISDDGFEFVDTTIPYGFVDPTTTWRYESVLESDGMTYNDYLTVRAFLWTGKFPELKEIFEKETVKQSMEIVVDSGEWDENYEYFNVKDGHFQALCLLGVEPCFESSKATVGYSLQNSEEMYQEMLDKFKQFAFEGGEDMEDVKTVEETVEAEVVTDEVVDEVVEDVQEEATDEVETVEVKEVVEQTEVQEQLEETEEIETTEEEVEVIEFKGKYNELQIEYGKVVSQLESMKVEFDELKQFKLDIELEQRKCAEDELFSKFESLHNDVDFIELCEKSSDYSLEELENMCYMMVGRKALSFSKKETKTKPNTKLKIENENKKPDIYGGLLD